MRWKFGSTWMNSTRDVCGFLLTSPAPSSPDLLPLPLSGPGKLLVTSSGFNGSFSPKPFWPPTLSASSRHLTPFYWAPQTPTHSSNLLFVPLVFSQLAPTSDCGNRWQDSISSLWEAQWQWMNASWLDKNQLEHLQEHWASLCPYSFFRYWLTRSFIHLWNDFKFITERESWSIVYPWKTSCHLQQFSSERNHKLIKSILSIILHRTLN